MPYLPVTPSYKPPRSPPPDSVPIQIHLLPMSHIHTLFILVIATPAILITVEGLSSYQQDIPCQLLVQLLHHIALAQLQHFRACPDNLPTLFGLPLRTTLSLLPGLILDLLVSHSFHRYLEELPTNILYPAFTEIFLSLTQAEQRSYLEQVGSLPSPVAVPLALHITSPPPSPATSSINVDDVIRIQIAEGQWITSSASRVLVQRSRSTSHNTQCYICSDLGHHGLFCPMHTCSTCGEVAPGHMAHHCLETQCDLCLRWEHSDNVCNLWICGRCDTPGHVVDNCPINPLAQPDIRYTYGGTYSDNNNLNTLVDDN